MLGAWVFDNGEMILDEGDSDEEEEPCDAADIVIPEWVYSDYYDDAGYYWFQLIAHLFDSHTPVNQWISLEKEFWFFLAQKLKHLFFLGYPKKVYTLKGHHGHFWIKTKKNKNWIFLTMTIF